MNEAHPKRLELEEDAESSPSGDATAEPRLPVAETARALRLSPATVRRYIADHGAHLDVRRDGRVLMVAAGSIPALAQIRDLRARKFSRPQIDRLLSALSGEASLAGLGAASSPAESTAADEAIAKGLAAMQRELARMKEELRENEVLIRQSIANVLFLVDKCNKDIQYFASEERIASKERDLRLTEVEGEYRRLSATPGRKKGLLSAFLARYRLVLATAFSR